MLWWEATLDTKFFAKKLDVVVFFKLRCLQSPGKNVKSWIYVRENCSIFHVNMFASDKDRWEIDVAEALKINIWQTRRHEDWNDWESLKMIWVLFEVNEFTENLDFEGKFTWKAFRLMKRFSLSTSAMNLIRKRLIMKQDFPINFFFNSPDEFSRNEVRNIANQQVTNALNKLISSLEKNLARKTQQII